MTEMGVDGLDWGEEGVLELGKLGEFGELDGRELDEHYLRESKVISEDGPDGNIIRDDSSGNSKSWH